MSKVDYLKEIFFEYEIIFKNILKDFFFSLRKKREKVKAG